MFIGSNQHHGAGTYLKSPLRSSCSGITWFQGVQLLTKGGQGKQLQVGPVMLFHRIYLEIHSALSRRFDHTDVLRSCFCFHGPDTYI